MKFQVESHFGKSEGNKAFMKVLGPDEKASVHSYSEVALVYLLMQLGILQYTDVKGAMGYYTLDMTKIDGFDQAMNLARSEGYNKGRSAGYDEGYRSSDMSNPRQMGE